jgi:hypothetical protein
MKAHFRPLALLAVILTLASCGDTEPEGVTLDFEDRPDDGFNTLTLPVTLAPGVTITASNDPMDFSTADGWGFVTCDATARSGNLMIGFNDSPDVAEITFATPISGVQVYAGSEGGEIVTLTAFDAQDQVVGIDARRSACPMITNADLLSVSTTANVITRLEIKGSWVALDDLTYYRVP